MHSKEAPATIDSVTRAVRTFFQAIKEMSNRDGRHETSTALLTTFGFDYRWLNDEQQAGVRRSIGISLLREDNLFTSMKRFSRQILDDGNFSEEAALQLAAIINQLDEEEV